MARCRWGEADGAHVTVPAVLEPMRLRCASYDLPTTGERTLALALNAEDFTTLSPEYGYYSDPLLTTFRSALEPAGAVVEGGTLITLHGAGFDVLPDAGTAFARCR